MGVFFINTLATTICKINSIFTFSIAYAIVALILLFGYLIETSEILNAETFVWAIGIVAGIFFIRMIILLVSRLPLTPLLFIAPRGLITILLFFSIIPSQQLPLVNKSVIIQVIILTAIIMMFGLMASKRDKTGKDKKRKSILNGNLQK